MIIDYFPLKAHKLHIMVFDYQDFVASASRCMHMSVSMQIHKNMLSQLVQIRRISV